MTTRCSAHCARKVLDVETARNRRSDLDPGKRQTVVLAFIEAGSRLRSDRDPALDALRRFTDVRLRLFPAMLLCP